MDTKTLKLIKEFTYSRYSDYLNRQHSIDHTLRVKKNATNIVKILKMENNIDINLLTACCYLHDILMIKNHDSFLVSLYFHLFERSINRKGIHIIVDRFNLLKSEHRLLTTAIVNHPHSIPYHILNKRRDLYSKILQDADTIDYISEQRLKIFNMKRWYLSPISKLYIRLIKKNIKYFLNFPELAKKLSLFH